MSFAAIITWSGFTFMRIGGLPGQLIAGLPGKRSKLQLRIGIIVTGIGQSIVYLMYVAFTVLFTQRHIEVNDVSGFILYPFAFIAANFPILFIRTTKTVRHIDSGSEYVSPQIDALNLTLILAFIGFFVFAIFPCTVEWAKAGIEFGF